MDTSEVRDRWAERTGAYSPDYYAYHGPDATSERLGEALAPLPADAPILELGCSSGRHLAYLHDLGYENLHGIDLNPDSFEVMDEAFPDLAAAGTFYADAIEAVVPAFEDDRFAAVYSAESLQHVHPEQAWVFEEIARVAADRIVTVETEGDAPDRRPSEPDGANGSNSVPDGRAERRADDPEVNVVDDVPLYYRDWNRVFTAFDFEQTDRRPAHRGTLRLFQTATS